MILVLFNFQVNNFTCRLERQHTINKMSFYYALVHKNIWYNIHFSMVNAISSLIIRHSCVTQNEYMYFCYRHVKKIKNNFYFLNFLNIVWTIDRQKPLVLAFLQNVSCVLTKTQPICNIFFQRTQPSIFSYGPLLEKILSQVKINDNISYLNSEIK